MFKKPQSKIVITRLICSIILLGLLFASYANLLNPNLTSSSPQTLAVDKVGYLYLADNGISQIQKLDAKGKVVSQWGKEGTAFNQFKRYYGPDKIVLDKQGNIYITQQYSNTVQKFTVNGDFIASWSLEFSPFQLLLDQQNNFIYATSKQAPYIHKYDLDGKLLTSWADKETFPNGLGILLNSQGEVLAAQYDKPVLYRFDQNGKLLNSWSTPDVVWSGAVTSDERDNIYVADDNGTIKKLNSQGQLLTSWSYLELYPTYDKPLLKSIVVDSQNNLYVLVNEDKFSKVKRFDTNGQRLDQWNLGWPFLSSSFLTPFFTILLVAIIVLISKIGRRQELKIWLETAREPLPDWVNEGSLKPASLYDHLNLTALSARAKSSSSALTSSQATTKQELTGCGFIVLVFMFAIGLTIEIFSSFSSLLGLVILVISLLGMAGIIYSALKAYKKQNPKISKTPHQILIGQALTSLPSTNDIPLISSSIGLGYFSKYLLIVLPMQLVVAFFSVKIPANISHNPLSQYLALGAITLTLSLVLWLANLLRFGRARLGQAALSGLLGNLWLLVGSFIAVGLTLDLVGNFLASQIEFVRIVTGFIGLVKYIFLVFGLWYSVDRWIRGKLELSDYEAALSRVSYLRSLLNAATLSQLQITILIKAGRLNEAEYLIQAQLINGLQTVVAPIIELLGIVRLYQARYAESMFLLESAIELQPTVLSGYNNLAEVYLRMHQYPERALELVKHSQTSESFDFLFSYMKADKFINQAWALSQSDHNNQVEKPIQKAFKLLGNKRKASLASFHYRTADIMSLSGNRAKANYHYEMAIVLDPNGFYGMQAKELLTT